MFSIYICKITYLCSDHCCTFANSTKRFTKILTTTNEGYFEVLLINYHFISELMKLYWKKEITYCDVVHLQEWEPQIHQCNQPHILEGSTTKLKLMFNHIYNWQLTNLSFNKMANTCFGHNRNYSNKLKRCCQWIWKCLTGDSVNNFFN